MEGKAVSDEVKNLLDERWERHLVNPEAALSLDELKKAVAIRTKMNVLRILPGVADDVAAGKSWYDRENSWLGTRFSEEVYQLISEILRRHRAEESFIELSVGRYAEFPYPFIIASKVVRSRSRWFSTWLVIL